MAIIGELFIKLGILGDGKVKQGLGGVKGGLKDAKDMSLEAKAAIVGMVYGLERLMSNSMTTGANLMTFSNVTGMSAERLQEWQYAAKHANVSAEEMESNFVNLQSVMAKLRFGGAGPAGLSMVSDILEKMGVGFDAERAGKDMEYLMKSLQTVSQVKGMDVALNNEILKGFVGHNTIGAFRQNAFTEENFAKAPKYSTGEAAKLQQVKNAWGDLEQMFEMSVGHLNAKHGLGLVKDLQLASVGLIKLLTGFTKLIEKTDALQLLGKVFEGWGEIFGLIGDVAGSLGGKDEKGKSNSSTWMKDLFSGKIGERLADNLQANSTEDVSELTRAPSLKALSGGVLPNLPKSGNNHYHQTTTVVNHNHNVKDAKDVGHHTKRAIQQAGRNSKAAGRPQ